MDIFEVLRLLGVNGVNNADGNGKRAASGDKPGRGKAWFECPSCGAKFVAGSRTRRCVECGCDMREARERRKK